MKIRCSEVENRCPYCGSYSILLRDEIMMDCSAYKVFDCFKCSERYAVPYLLIFDDQRPKDEMEVEL